jgi:tetratricopeptide (TPR) repeat protein
MRSHFILPAMLAVLLAAPALANDASPWLDDTTLLHQTQSEVGSQGLGAVAPHAAALEKALTGAPHSIALARAAGFVLTDGPADTLVSLMAASKDHKNVSALPDPYPLIGLYLGSYYDEIGRREDGLRALDAGLAISTLSSVRPALLIERGAALNGLHRSAEALADFEGGLKIPNVDVHLRAAMMRGRGFALTELNRLDEAEAAYQDSLKVEPGNPRAENELRYIAKLRAGGSRVEGTYSTMNAKVDSSGKVEGTPTEAPKNP